MLHMKRSASSMNHEYKRENKYTPHVLNGLCNYVKKYQQIETGALNRL